MNKLDLTQYVESASFDRMIPAFTIKGTCSVAINSDTNNSRELAEQYTEYCLRVCKSFHKIKINNAPPEMKYYYGQEIISLPKMLNKRDQQELHTVLKYPLVSFGLVLESPTPPIFSPNGNTLVPARMKSVPSGEIYLSYALENKTHITEVISDWIVKLQHPEEFKSDEDPIVSWHHDTYSTSMLFIVYNELPTLENIKTVIQDVLIITRMFPIITPYESLV